MNFLKKYRPFITVILALVFAVSLLPVLQLFPSAPPEWTTRGTIALCLIIFLAALLSKDWFDAVLIFLIGLGFAAGSMLLKTSALMAFALLNLVMLIGPWSRFLPRVRGWYRHRRHLGVAAFLLAFFHANLVITLYFGRDLFAAWQMVFTFFGSLALFIMGVLAATSWDWMQKHVSWKTWTVLHAAVFIVYLAGVSLALRLWFMAGVVPVWTFIAFGMFTLFWIIIAPWGLAPRIMKVVNGWKQLHVLSHVAYVSVMLHLYFGSAQVWDAWQRVGLIALFGLVEGSHIAGWIRHGLSRWPKVLSKDDDWYDVIAQDKLHPGQGKRVEVNGLPLALFLHEGRVLAYFGYCSHQKGPLWEGKIVDGYLECPWHGWQFSVADGKAPPGFHDQVPFYETKIENGRVWVKMEPGKECKGYACTACRCRG